MKIITAAAFAAALFASTVSISSSPLLAFENAPVLQTAMGTASWYGGKFHGRKTANGERYNMHELTAAHRSLPFGTMVRVINENTGQSVIVRINDRGPFVGNRVIDLSHQAASQIGMVNAGVARVKLEVLG